MLRRQFIQTTGAALAVLGLSSVFARANTPKATSANDVTKAANKASVHASAVAKEVGLKPAPGKVERKA